MSDKSNTYNEEFELFKTKVSQGVKELNDEIAQLKAQIKDRDRIIYEMKHGSISTKVKRLFGDD